MKTHTKIALFIGGGVMVLWAGCGLLLYSLPDRGTFGDMFGAVNALFSGLAFAGVIYALLLQHEEIEQAKAAFLHNAQAQKDTAQLQALTLLFQEYKQLSEEKNDEINKRIGIVSSDLSLRLEKERNEIIEKRDQIFSSLAKTAGLSGPG
jgi:hypothetical protein